MIMFANQPISQQLEAARIAITNARDVPTIRNALSEYGYNEEKLQGGFLLYETALSAQQQQKAEYGDQYNATDQLNQNWETAKASYNKLLKIARVAFKDNPGIAGTLALNGAREATLSGWLLQAQQFYTNALANPDILSALASYGITEEKIALAKADTEAVVAAKSLQTKEKGEAQSATQTRNQALEELRDWMRDFIEIARIALAEQPQLLETLGIVEPS